MPKDCKNHSLQLTMLLVAMCSVCMSLIFAVNYLLINLTQVGYVVDKTKKG